MQGGWREEGQALSKTHHSLVNDTLLSFSHTILPLLLTLHKSNVGSSTVHNPQVVRKTLPRPRGSVWRHVWVCVVPLTVVEVLISPQLHRRCSVFCLVACLSGVSLVACVCTRCFLSLVADLLPLCCYCGIRAEKCLSVPVTKICKMFFLRLLRCLLIVTHWLYKVQNCRWRHLKSSPHVCCLFVIEFKHVIQHSI